MAEDAIYSVKRGDMVLYHAGPHERFNNLTSTPAVVTRVWDQDHVNLHIFKDAGGTESRTSILRRGVPGVEVDYARGSFEHPIPPEGA